MMSMQLYKLQKRSLTRFPWDPGSSKRKFFRLTLIYVTFIKITPDNNDYVIKL